MNNFFDFIKDLPSVKRLHVNELLLVEYQCPVDEPHFDIWSHYNYFVYVLNGQKKWRTLNQEINIQKGDCLFVRKGAHTVVPYFESDPCVLMLFIPDEFIRSVILENKIKLNSTDSLSSEHALFMIDVDKKLNTYFHSFFTYLSDPDRPSDKLLELKFRELVLMITSGSYCKKITNYFVSLCREDKVSLREVMEANYNYPLNLKEFAKLSCRSLSTFKRDFKNIYATSPGRWLCRKRLELAKYLLEHTSHSVFEVVSESGFKNKAHFYRVFKKKFNMTPVECRKKAQSSKK